MVQFYLLEADNDPGTGAETITRDLPRVGTTKALIFDITAQQSSTTPATRAALGAQLDEISIAAEESNAVSEIDGEDLDALNGLLGNHPLFDAGTVSNHRVTLGYTYPLDPFMVAPQIDYNQPFGISGRVARKVRVKYAADGGNIDSKKLAIGIIVDNQGTEGYVSFGKDSDTITANVNHKTDVPQPGKLLGVLNFETTGAADVTADGGHRSDQTIEEQAITINNKDVLGPLYTTMYGAMNGSYEIGSLTDEGYSLLNLGIHNRLGKLGIQRKTRIPTNMEIRSKGGDAGDAGRIYAITLNDNV